MKITFGISTYSTREHFVEKSIQSIKDLEIPNYEIIVIGGENCYSSDDLNIKHIKFDENIVKGWVTKKKNLITEHSNFDVIVIQADYITFDKDWYVNLIKYGKNFHVMSNRIIKENGERHHDWNLSKINNNRFDKHVSLTGEKILPYNIDFLSKYMYITGSFFIAKKHVLLEFPFDENLVYGQGDDIEWSHRVRKKYDFCFNQLSTVRIIDKNQNRFSHTLASSEFIEKYKKFDNSKVSKFIDKIYFEFLKYHLLSFIKKPLVYLEKVKNKLKKLIYKQNYYKK
tara:strand:+ start:1955 stop:2806 length:852 start_codon:yes stop_codon:yes gene_type:complete